MEENSVDSVVCDPPYFLTNGSGSGFMGKEWDSLSVVNAFAESLLRSMRPVWLMVEENTVQENANIPLSQSRKQNHIIALYAEKNSLDQTHKLSLAMFSVQELVITKAEALVLSSALCPSLTKLVEGAPENVLFVIRDLTSSDSPKGIALELASRLHTLSACEDLEILRTLMAERKTNEAFEATTGKFYAQRFIDATNLDVKNVESIVAEKRYNATTSSPIEFQKIIRWITSSRSVRNAMATFTANPGSIQLLSERFHYNWLTEVYRVMKPGGHLLAFGGTRTYHRLVCAIEDAGFEIRDQIQWLFSSGFPKSHNGEWGGTALKPANEPICLARKPLSEKTVKANFEKWGVGGLNIDESRIRTGDKFGGGAKRGTNGQTYGTFETYEKGDGFVEGSPQGRWPANLLLDEEASQIINDFSGQDVARFFYVCGQENTKDGVTFVGKITANKNECLSIDGSGHKQMGQYLLSTISITKTETHSIMICPILNAFTKMFIGTITIVSEKTIDESLVTNVVGVSVAGNTSASLHLASGQQELITGTVRLALQQTSESGVNETENIGTPITENTGNGLKAFYVAKASKRERNAGLEGMPERMGDAVILNGICANCRKVWIDGKRKGPCCENPERTSEAKAQQSNHHPTVKPIKLMEYLINLVTPPGGIVLDPFMGSGSTGVAAHRLGFKFIGIEMNEEYVEIAKRRIENETERGA